MTDLLHRDGTPDDTAPRRPRRASLRAALLAALATAGTGCMDLVYRVALPLLYVDAPLPADRIVRDLPYRTDAGSDPRKNGVDLFLAEGRGWPVLVFVHGGGWTSGDRGLRVGGADVYGNIGRFYAARGIGVAVVGYRLQPAVGWHDQVDDVAQAVAWVHREIGRYGGDPDAIFVSGHSAGGELVARVALDPAPLARLGVAPSAICGLIPVSGAGFDLADAQTYALGADPAYYEARFRDGVAGDDWRAAGSVTGFARAAAPPSLILYAEGDTAPLRRQSERLHDVLVTAGAESRVVVVPGESHQRMVLVLSRADKAAAPAILDFVRATRCGRAAHDA